VRPPHDQESALRVFRVRDINATWDKSTSSESEPMYTSQSHVSNNTCKLILCEKCGFYIEKL
jgi:hypothetical protein